MAQVVEQERWDGRPRQRRREGVPGAFGARWNTRPRRCSVLKRTAIAALWVSAIEGSSSNGYAAARMDTDSRWFEVTRRVVQLFTAREVKTPLSFAFRWLTLIAVLLVCIVFAPLRESFKEWLITGMLIMLVGAGVIVMAFAWFRPRHLLYGEAGYRAERRLEFGTERRTITATELDALGGGENRRQLPRGDA